MEIALSYNSLFQERIKKDKDLASFKDVLSQFLKDVFLPLYENSNARVEFKIFVDPDTTHQKPMVEITLSNFALLSRGILHHEFNSKFKEFLAKISKGEDEFLKLRAQQRNIMFVFTIE